MLLCLYDITQQYLFDIQIVCLFSFYEEDQSIVECSDSDGLNCSIDSAESFVSILFSGAGLSSRANWRFAEFLVSFHQVFTFPQAFSRRNQYPSYRNTVEGRVKQHVSLRGISTDTPPDK
ncbi:hypothetical protein ACROYT_G024013 [Oculina patagonica]